MSNDNSSTVLSEHSKIFSLRHILAIFNFLIILACTVVTILLSARKGTPTGVQILLYVLLAVNVGQLGVCIADYVLKQHFGFYTKWLTIASYSLGVLWVALTAGELVAASIAFGLLRMDLLIISVIQLVVAFLIYVVWPYLDRKSLDVFVRPSVRADSAKKNAEFKMFVGIYCVFCVILTFVQLFGLFVYRMPPKLYDLFSDTRAVEYTADGDGYVVTKVYRGTSSVVNIPATYNNKPVKGIAKGAIDDSELIDKYRISEITFGTVEKDADGNEKTISYLQYIESGAIVNDKIESLVIPESVEEIGNGAISSTSLKSLQYEGRADFSFSYIKCNSLATLFMSGDNVGRLVSIEDKSTNCEIFVSKDIYNQYRQDNYRYMGYFVPILEDGEFCIDFYTDCDYYIESIISTGDAVELKYSDLYNQKLTGIAPSVDTLAFIKDNHELGTNGAKANSAFRGWYFDKNFTEPCAFTESTPLQIKRSVSIYAKWIDEYNANLNWGTYQPNNTSNVLYWTDEDEKTLPVITDRTGYKEGIQWVASDTETVVTTTKGISRNLNFNGKWVLDAPDIGILLNYDTTDTDFRVSRQQDNVTFTYSEQRSLPLVAELKHSLGNNSVVYSYKWQKTSGEQSSLEKVDASRDTFGHNIQDMGITIRNVRQSGVYTLFVTATAKTYGEQSTAQTLVTVTVNKKDLNIGDAYYQPEYEYTYNSKHIFRTVESNIAVDVKPEYLYTDTATGKTTNAEQGIINVGTYTVSATFAKIDADERDNYNTKTILTTVKINPAPLNYVGWFIDNDNKNNSIVYDGKVHTYNLKVDGALGNENVNVLYETQGYTATNAGIYTAKVTGVDNPNYTLDEINQANLNSEWTIKQRQVKVHLWQVNNSFLQDQKNSFEYDGTEHSVSAVMSGRVMGDNVDFVYDSQEAFVMKATLVGDYKALITGVNNTNYYFDTKDENAQFDWSITKRKIYAEFGTVPTLYYNAAGQGITARITNIAPSDVSKFSYEMFDFTGSSSVLTCSDIRDQVNNKLTLVFNAINANTGDSVYTANIAGLVSQSLQPLLENYKLEFIGTPTEAGLSRDFKINPKTLGFVYGSYTYNGAEQDLKLRVVGIETKDLAGVEFDMFDTTAVEGANEGNYYYLIYKGTNAAQYPVSVTAFKNTNYTFGKYTGNITIDRKQLTLSSWTITDNSKPDAAPVKLIDGDVKYYNFNGYTVNAVLNGIVPVDETLINYGLTYTKRTETQKGNYTTQVSLDKTKFTNYTFTTNGISWEITPYIINDISWNISGQNVTGGVIYDGTEKSLAYDFKRLGTDTVAITYESSSVLSATNAGTYQVTVKGTDNPNYALNKDYKFSWQIKPATVTVNWNAEPSYTYSGQYQAPSFSLSGIVAADSDKLANMTVTVGYSASGVTNVGTLSGNISQKLTEANTYNYNVGAASVGGTGFAVDAGSYVMTVTHVTSFKDSTDKVGNYNYTVSPSSASKSFTIAKKTVSLSGEWKYSNSSLKIENATFTNEVRTVYNATNYTLTTSLADGGLVKRLTSSSVDNVILVYSDNVRAAAGSYTAKVTGLSGTYANNYSLSATGNSLGWKIDQKVLRFSWKFYSTESESKPTVYSASNQTNIASFGTVAASSATFDDGKAISGTSVNLTYADNIARNAGTYTARITALSNANYMIDESSNSTCIWTISPKAVSISWDKNAFTYNGAVQHPTATFGVNGETIDKGIYYGGDTAAKDYKASDYTINVERIDNVNYTLADGKNLSCSYKIKQLPVVLKWSMAGSTTETLANWTYDGKTRTVSAFVYNACAGDSFTYVYKDNPNRDFKNQGTYTLSVENVTNNNYTLINGSNISTSFTVSKRAADLTWKLDNKVVTADPSIIYDGQAHSLTATVSNVCAGDTVNVNYSGGNSWTNVNSYGLTVESLSNDNYLLKSNTSRTLKINAQPVKITWTGSTSVTYDGSPHLLNATVTGKNDGKAVGFKYSTAGNSATNAGEYRVTILSVLNANYTLDSVTNTSATLTIVPRSVGLTWTNYKGIYDGKSHCATAIVTGAVDGDTVTVNGYSVNSATNAGEYKVTAVTLSSKNYKISDNVGGYISIAPQPVTITWTVDSKQYVSSMVYDAKSHKLQASVKGTNDGISVATFSDSRTAAGNISLSVTDLNNNNYTLVGCIGTTQNTFTIKPITVTANWEECTETYYNGKTYSLTPTFSGVLTGQNVNPVYSIKHGSTTANGNSATAVGTYTVKVIRLENSNYTLATDAGGTLIIEKQKVKIEYFSNNTAHGDLSQYMYNGANQTLTVKVTGYDDGVNLRSAVSVIVKKSGTAVQSAIDAGTYTYTVSNLTNSNYTLEGADTEATQIINKAKVTVTWSCQEVGGAYLVTATVKDAATGKKTVSVKSYKVDDDRIVTSMSVSLSEVGEHTVTLNELADSNYTLEHLSNISYTVTVE